MVTDAALWPPDEEKGKPGYGPISNGVPRAMGRGGRSTDDMPDPPRQSRYCGPNIGEDDTQRIRRAR